jgi:hypothetical protein
MSNYSVPMMHIEFELFPISTIKSDYRFHLNIQPIIIIYDAVSYTINIQKICSSWFLILRYPSSRNRTKIEP